MLAGAARVGAAVLSLGAAGCGLLLGPEDAGVEVCEEPPARGVAEGGAGEKRDASSSTSGFLQVVGGTERPTTLSLSDAQLRAVVGIAHDEPFEGAPPCSGVLIAPRFVLTARHCTQGRPASALFPRFGPELLPELVMQASVKREHPVHDVTLLEVPTPPSDYIDVEPIPVDVRDLLPGDVGALVEQAGVGTIDTDGTRAGLRFVAEPLVGFEGARNFFVVDGDGARGVCFGDSGGPSLRAAPGGEPRVIGVLSWGNNSCVDLDRYTRTDAVRGWIEERIGPTPPLAPVACAAVDVDLGCSPDARVLRRCTDGVWDERACRAGETCTGAGAAAACTPTAALPCGKVTDYGTCAGHTLRYCADDDVIERACAACGEACAQVSGALGFDCVQSRCGEVTAFGQCDGDVARWCADGALRRRDCARGGLVCDVPSSDTGATCVPPAFATD